MHNLQPQSLKYFDLNKPKCWFAQGENMNIFLLYKLCIKLYKLLYKNSFGLTQSYSCVES